MFEQLSHKICVAVLSVMLLSAFTACIHDGEGQTAAAPDYKLHFNISTEGKWTDGSRYTRGTFLNEPEDGIGIFGYNYAGEWDEDKSSTLFYNDQLIGFGSEWMTSGNYVIPYGINNPNRNLRFFAYYPYAEDPTEYGIDFNKTVIDPGSEEEDAQYMIYGAPVFNYVVPADVERQVDLMVGQTGEHTLIANAADWDTYSFKLYHLLTAVRIKVGSEIVSGQVTKVTLKNIKYKGCYEYDPNNTAIVPEGDDVRWYTQDVALTNFSQNIGVAIKEGETDYITDETQTFMMMPQVLNQAARLEIEFIDGQKHLLYAIIGGKKDNPAYDPNEEESPTNPLKIDREWKRAKVVTYTVNIKTLQKITVTTTITDWDNADNSVTGSVSDAATIVTKTNVDDWTEGHVINAGDIIANQSGSGN